MCKVNDLPNFERLCCLKTPVDMPERTEKVVSDLLDSSLQGVPCALRCLRWQLNEREEANSPPQFLHLKFKNRSVCLLCVWLDWRCIDILSNWKTLLCACWYAVTAAVEVAQLRQNSQQTEEQKKIRNILTACNVSMDEEFHSSRKDCETTEFERTESVSKVNVKTTH